MVLSRNTLFLPTETNSTLTHMDGLHQDIQDLKDHTTALLVEMSALEEPLLMLTTKHAYMLVSQFLEQTLKSCQDNGNSKLDLA